MNEKFDGVNWALETMGTDYLYPNLTLAPNKVRNSPLAKHMIISQSIVFTYICCCVKRCLGSGNGEILLT